MSRLRSLLERWNDGLLLSPFGKWVKAASRLLANLSCSGAGIGKANMLQRSQSDIAALAAILHPNHPMAATGPFQIEKQPITVRVTSRFLEALDFQCAEISHNSGSNQPPHSTLE